MRTLVDFLYRIVRPGWWVQIHPTCYLWDKVLNILLDRTPEVTELGPHTVKLDGHEIWISNYPFGYGNLYFDTPSVVPRPKTRKRLKDYVQPAIDEYNKTKHSKPKYQDILKEIKLVKEGSQV